MHNPMFVDRQVPTLDEIFLDHTAHFVSDLDVAGKQLARLGFTVSTINLQKNLAPDGSLAPSGTSNRLVRLRRGFLEILAATHATPLAEQLQHALARYTGIHLLAFSHENLELARTRLIQSGFAMQPMVHMRRLAPESGKEVAWSVLRTEPQVMREGRIQFVYPHTPELSWPPGSFNHPNGADSLTGVTICVEDIDEATNRYRRFLGLTPDNATFRLDRGYVKLVTLNDAKEIFPDFSAPDLPYICAVTVRTTQLELTREFIRTSRIVPVIDTNTALWLRPQDALGCYLGFHESAYPTS